MRAVLALILLVHAAASAADQEQAEAAAANPVRKVVTLLQAMQKKVEEEAKKEKELFDNFMCYCKTNGNDLKEKISSANVKIPQVQSEIEQAEAQKAQLEEDLKQHQVDRDAAKTAIADATAIREKEAAEFAKEKAEYDANIAAVTKAVTAIEKGMAGGFLQTGAAQVLRKLLTQKTDMLDMDRQEVLAFLSGTNSEEYVPKSSEIVGILKELNDEMSRSLADITGEEEAAVKAFEELLAAKKKEVSVLSKAIEEKTERVGQLAVEIVQKKNELSDSEEQLIEDQKFAADLEQGCSTKEKEWDERQRTRAEELTAIAETIKMLNDDDALDLFKKTLPSASSASFVQVKVNSARDRAHALALIRAVQQRYRGDGPFAVRRPELDFLALALQGSKIGFEKVIKMIDDMVRNLNKEQTMDEFKKENCMKQMDETEDQKKSLERTVADLETSMADAEEAITAAKEDIKALEESIKALDKQVAEETEQRKAEHEEFTELMSSNSAAKDILGMAKNRLNKFYNPKLYVAPETTTGAAMLAQVKVHVQGKAGIDPPPETFEGEYSKKGEESTGVIAMIDLLVKDLDKEMTEAETQEEDSQKDYEQFMKDSSAKRATDSKALTQKNATKAALETTLEAHKEKKVSSESELAATNQVLSALHSECDWLLKYYDMRKEARDGEIDALKKAKAVLSGADYAFMQTVTKPGNLRRQPRA